MNIAPAENPSIHTLIILFMNRAELSRSTPPLAVIRRTVRVRVLTVYIVTVVTRHNPDDTIRRERVAYYVAAGSRAQLSRSPPWALGRQTTARV